MGVKPWFHDPENWLNYHSTEGYFLQVSVTDIDLPFNFKRFKEAFENSTGFAVLTYDFHPYEIQNWKTGKLDDKKIKNVQKSIQQLKKIFSPTFININDLGKIYEIN